MKKVIPNHVNAPQEPSSWAFVQSPASFQLETWNSAHIEANNIARVFQRSLTIPATIIATNPVKNEAQYPTYPW